MLRLWKGKTYVIAVLLGGLGACARPAEVPVASSGAVIEVPGDGAASKTDGAATIGADSTVEIEAPSYVVMEAMCQVGLMWRVLPRVASIEPLSEGGQEMLWRVTHSLAGVRGGYVMRLRPQWLEEGRASIDFRVDKRMDRDVEDGWGYFRIEPLGPDRTLLRYSARVVLAPGLIRWLFSNKIQWALTVVPQRVKVVVEEQMAVQAWWDVKAAGTERAQNEEGWSLCRDRLFGRRNCGVVCAMLPPVSWSETACAWRKRSV